jgi:hypothetical protein
MKSLPFNAYTTVEFGGNLYQISKLDPTRPPPFLSKTIETKSHVVGSHTFVKYIT